MDVVLSKRPREVDEGEGQAKDCFVSFMGSNSLSQIDPSPSVICYGALNDAAAQCLANTTVPEELHLTNCNGYHRFPVTFKDGTCLLGSRENESYAILDTHSTRKLAVLRELSSVKLEAITDTGNLLKRRNKSNRRQTFSVFINIFGPQDVASDAASRLSKASAFLQHPKSLEPGIIYSNPQFFRVPGMEEDMNKYVGLGDRLSSQRKATISAEIHNILCSLTRVESFQAGLPQGIQAVLKPHQEDAFSFILQRETEAVCNNLQIGLQQVARVSNATQPAFYGGIIADVMGLGKTLTMLTAILRSLPPTCNFDKGNKSEMSTKTPTRATLVVVTSAQLIESWRAEITRHFVPGYLNYIVFHGSKRTSNKNDLISPSIVITTYATVVADHEGFDVLGRMNWYRVVLDEAHWIRNPTSKQFRAVSSLTTNRRWCITGTPIQNKLEELASLASFLRLPPFSTRSSFHSNILLPLSQGGPNYARPLRAYLGAYCLRRTETHLNLPQSSEETIFLSFSPEETKLYKAILEQSRREIDELVSSAANIRRYNILFTAILKMRMLCNRGTLSPAGRTAYLLPQKPSIKCGRCSEICEDDELLLESLSFCPDCDRPLHMSSLDPHSRLSPISDCMENDMISPESTYSVEPHSTKLSSVVDNVRNHGIGAKHIVFSYWTSTLDALEQLFNTAGICHVQIDGRTSYAERSNRLNKFREDPRVTVLLMSIETGSVGLNLTAASVVHIVEPQWNPSVEEQAVARALRMGQTKEVKIFRYVMRGTVEENIIGLQKKKRKLATFTFGEDDKGAQEKLEDLKFVLNADIDMSTTTPDRAR
ncbi:Ff.00g025450.m01.CDS01 [Fusarium sp. VM40]|nr:Ff.00g025450.m01.CDS01 [Fusarium sp. VM40]